MKKKSYAVSAEDQTKPCWRGHLAGKTARGACLACIKLLSRKHYEEKVRPAKAITPRPPKVIPPPDPKLSGESPLDLVINLKTFLRTLEASTPRDCLLKSLDNHEKHFRYQQHNSKSGNIFNLSSTEEPESWI